MVFYPGLPGFCILVPNSYMQTISAPFPQPPSPSVRQHAAGVSVKHIYNTNALNRSWIQLHLLQNKWEMHGSLQQQVKVQAFPSSYWDHGIVLAGRKCWRSPGPAAHGSTSILSGGDGDGGALDGHRMSPPYLSGRDNTGGHHGFLKMKFLCPQRCVLW